MSAPSSSVVKNARHLLGLVIPVFREHRYRLALGFTALLLVDALQLTVPRLIKLAVDGLESRCINGKTLLWIGAGILAAALGMALFRFCWRYLIIGFSRILEKNLRDRIYQHLLGMDQPFFDRRTTGDLMAHSSNDLASVQLAFGMGMVAATDALVISLAAIGFMAAINLRLTIMALAPMPFLALATRVLAARMHKRFLQVQGLFSELTEFSRAAITSIRLIKAYTLESLQLGAFDLLGRRYVRANLRVASVQGLIFPAATMAGSLGMLIVLSVGGRLVIDSQITLGDFVAFIAYLNMLIWPMMAVGWVTSLAQRGLTSLGRIDDLLQERPLVHSTGISDIPLPLTSPCIVCQQLSFSYPGVDKRVLDRIDLAIAPGILGITGPTGAGKSSLCKLLLRMYPVPDQRLFIQGIDVNQVDPARIRTHIAFVSQEPLLFSASIRRNIAMARPDASLEEVRQAARLAAVDAEIMAFPDGYEARIGERGVRLSGGQKQRVALARAILSGRRILIIDDGLSALDVATEQQVLDALVQGAAAEVILIVSHRINVLRRADRIIIVDQGRVVASGGHEDLLDNEFYQAMLEKQERHG
ncbi:MAG: multidrug ABC transporter ATP-binding protein [Desulfobulbus propionicus]|nr:MAG: multidrug ABC transporter ATP-binding protein [Desulfobulbus propionicus]